MGIDNKEIKWIIFDADRTLFSFDTYAGVTHMFQKLDIPLSKGDYEAFEKINEALWKDLTEKKISFRELEDRCFKIFENKTGLSSKKLSDLFLESIGEVTYPLPSATFMLKNLSEKYKLALMTNGSRPLQNLRIQKYQLENIFEFIVTSDEVGVGKPNKEIFDCFSSQADHPDKNQVMIVGDDYSADIVGGLNYGIYTCWLNHNDEVPYDKFPTYSIKSLEELSFLLN